MTKEKARVMLEEELVNHISTWLDRIAQTGTWSNADLGYIHEDINKDMAKAASLILFSLSDAQKYAVEEGYLKSS